MSKEKITLVLVSLVLLVGGPVLGYKGFTEIAACLRAQGWPTADGTVTASQILTRVHNRSRRGESETHEVVVAYDYAVDGKPLKGNRLTFGGRNNNSRDDAQDSVARSPVGAAVRVHYDPDAPNESVLDPATTFWSWFSLALGPTLLIGGVLLLRWVIRLKPVPPDDAAPAAG